MEHEVDMLIRNVAYRLKEIRLTKRLRLQDVAVETKQDKNAIRRLESGAQHFTIGTVVPIIIFYKVPYHSVIKQYTRLPTSSEWKYLERLQKANNRYHKSKKRLKPNIGVQLKLEL